MKREAQVQKSSEGGEEASEDGGNEGDSGEKNDCNAH